MRSVSPADDNAIPRTQLDLRAHHLLCLHGFRGLGYGEAFVANMRQVKERLEQEQDSIPVQVHLGPDVICRVCPWLGVGGECTRAGVSNRDRAVMAALEIEAGAVRPWHWWVERVALRIPSARFVEICGDCTWFPLGYCQAGIERIRQTCKGG